MRKRHCLRTITLIKLVAHCQSFKGRADRDYGFRSVLSGMFRSAVPMLKRIGKQALTTGAHIASDMLAGKKFNESARARVRQGINSFLPFEDVSEQTGSGRRRRVVKRKRTTKQPKSVKRLRDIFNYWRSFIRVVMSVAVRS